MSEITAIKIQERNKKRCNIFIDGEYSFAASVDVVFSQRLKVGDKFEQAKLQEIIDQAERTDALTKAVDYISRALKTKRQVKDYLIKKGYSEEVAYYVIDKLKEYGYINDVEYSKRFIESTKSTQGKRLMQYKLMSKGVRKDDIDAAYEGTEDSAKQDAFKLATKYMRNKEKTKENISKTYRYLIGRGFSYEEADFAVEQFKSEG